MTFAKFIRIFSWAMLALWVTACIFLIIKNRDMWLWPVIYSILIVASFIIMLVILYKFKLHQYAVNITGKMFGLVLGIMLFSFISQVAWIVLNVFLNDIMPASVLGAKPYIIFSSILVNFTRGTAYVLGIVLLMYYVKTYNIKPSFNKQVIAMIASVVIIAGIETAILHPFIMRIFTENNAFLIAKEIIDIVCPMLNIVMLVLALWIFILSIRIRASKAILGLIVFSGLELLYIGMINNEYYNIILSQVIAFGYMLVYLILVKNASAEANPAKSLSKAYYDLLKYIYMNRNCIKKDITRNFNITRMTTDQKLRKLSEQGLIRIAKDGRVRLIELTDAGLVTVKAFLS